MAVESTTSVPLVQMPALLMIYYHATHPFGTMSAKMAAGSATRVPPVQMPAIQMIRLR